MKAKKSFGQHFLKEEPIARRIAESLQWRDQYQYILEVGPGMGVLTRPLLEIYPNHQFYAIDADADMVQHIKTHLPEMQEKLWLGDFLQLNFKEKFGEQPFALIGNFPYNISSQILFKVLENRQQVPEVVGMFQKEVAERVVASPEDNKEYGILSVLLQAFYHCQYLFTVKPGSFNPPPKVMSAVIRLQRKNIETLGCDEVLFKSIVKITFGQRRKMLRNTLKSFVTAEQLEKCPFAQQRPEELSVQQFVELTNWVASHK